MTANIVVPRQAHDAPRHLWSSLMTIQPSDKVLSIRQTAAVMNLSVRPSSVSARAVPDHGKSCFPPAVWASASAMWLHGSMDGLSARRALDRVRTNGSSGVESP